MLPWRWLKAASAEPCITNLRILLAKSVLPICSWDWQISEPAFYEAIAPSDGCTDGFASRVREFANSIRSFLIHAYITVSENDRFLRHLIHTISRTDAGFNCCL